MTDPGMKRPRPEREELALQEVGRTEVSRGIAALLVALFLSTVAMVPVLEPLLSDPSEVLEVALSVLPETVQTAQGDGLLAANRALLDRLQLLEEALEDSSFLRSSVLPPTQYVLRTYLGVGNEQVYLGRDGWLFLRADFEHVTGSGFLDPERLRREDREGARAADPLPAIVALDRDLAARGIELVVMPTPVKPTVHPEFLTRSAGAHGPIHNPSFGEFLDRLQAEDVVVFDPSTAFSAAKARGEGPLYLRTDTHWTPPTVELAAAELAALLDSVVRWNRPATERFVRRHASVTGQGDLDRLLEGSAAREVGEAERTEVARIVDRRGRAWTPDRESEVLLLGDSFANIYSDAALGWGTGAGLAEQLSFSLGRSVDRIAVNAGGSWSSRQALVRAAGTTTGSDRLAGKRVVVYQFATRELSTGDWKVLAIPGERSR